MKIGFTGTRKGMTVPQALSLAKWLKAHKHQIVEFHHGCCVGSDADAVALVSDSCEIIAHPPTDHSLVSAISIDNSQVVRKQKPYLTRNRNIVNESDILLACPEGAERIRSGTWSTIRYARSEEKQIIIFWPNGNTTEEE